MLSRLKVISEQHSLSLSLTLIYLLSLILSSLFLVVWLNWQVSEDGQRGLQRLEHFIDQTRETLQQITQQHEYINCSAQTITELRQHVFLSSRLKEVGLMDQNHRIYCVSNAGPVNFKLYPETRKRLADSTNDMTLSLTKAKMSQSRSLFIYYQAKDGMGADALLRPQTFLDITRRELNHRDLLLDVQVIGKSLNEQEQRKQEPVKSYQFESRHYPLTLRLCITDDYLIWYLVKHSWLGLLIGSLFSILYMHNRLRRLSRNSLSSSLIRAIRKKELEVYLQPIFDQRNQQICGAEALMRWKHPEEGFISPGIFIPLAEQLGLIEDLTDLVLDQVSELILKHPELIHNRYISVNISRLHLLQNNLADQLRRRCQKMPELARHLLLEITEDTPFTEAEVQHIIQQLEHIQSAGIRLAVDDFGTGYSSLDFIRRFPFDLLKIDRVFINSLGKEAAIEPMLEAIVRLSDELNMTIIAEGIEQQDQADKLAQLNIFLLQGFLLARPMPEHDFITLLQQHAHDPEQAAPLSDVMT
ncbi:EAL domain-containing protein [Oceanospirillum sediminis]|uniref:cyclic-guanylate-specific phosphodiesterase n=1 Tax=Oceanospirillum sediminis TaxID=2760088 RepID=A0A839IU20_9GAMM|nr:EAL domain-containing protein [Oceanospirillum sediminis]MBB1488134.1 EAL domain-containing protein [Oceanospirillum sediminis]